MGNRIGISGHVRKVIPIMAATPSRQLLNEDTTHDAEQDKRRMDLDRYVINVYGMDELIARLSKGLRDRGSKTLVLELIEEHAGIEFTDIEHGWKDSLT